jgi:hypothetical protein
MESRPQCSVSRSTAAIALAISVALLVLAASAGAAKPGKRGGHAKRARVEIISPRPDAQPMGAVVAKVKVRGGNFRAHLNGHDVTKRFHGKGVRTATFRKGKVLRPGTDDLFVSAGSGRTAAVDSSRFVLRVRDPKLLHLHVRRKGSYVAPLIHVGADGELRSAKVWLNGRRIDKRLGEDEDHRGITGRVEPSRLRFGRNRLKVAVLLRDGRFATRRASFVVPRDEPIAYAGHDRVVGVGGAARLDASRSRLPTVLPLSPAPPKAKGQAVASVAGGPAAMEYSWKLIEAPPGSEAKVLEPANGDGEAELIPDVPGQYTALVTATAPDGSQSIDDLVIAAPPTGEPLGFPIQTITGEGAIQLGNPEGKNLLGEPTGSVRYQKRGNWVQMLVLDASDAATPSEKGPYDSDSGLPEPKNGVLAFNVGEGAKLLKAVEATDPGFLVVLSGQGQAVKLGKSDATDLGKAIEKLGGTVSAEGTTPDGAADLASGQWSLIGHTGLTSGRAAQNSFHTEAGIKGFLGESTGSPGSLNGYMQRNLDSLGFQFISPEVVPIDTKWTAKLEEAPNPVQNTIEVGDAKYTSLPLNTGQVGGCPCGVGIQLLVLEQGTLKATLAGTFGIITSGGQSNLTGINALDAALHQVVTDHAAGASSVVVLQDFGTSDSADWPAGNSPEWLEDTLPDSSWTPEWEGYPFPNSLKDLSKTWNQAYQYGSVAGNLGTLVGTGFHDVVANYRRPYYSETAHKVVPRNWGGLTAITSTNLSDRSSAFGVGQGTNPPPGTPNSLLFNGRITGALTRNQQGQWELTAQASGAGYPGLVNSNVTGAESFSEYDAAGLPELVLAPPSKWPCSALEPQPCSSNVAEVKAAMAFVAANLKLIPGYTDVREAFAVDSVDWSSVTAELSKKAEDCSVGEDEAGQKFAPAVCAKLKEELETEFGQLGQVKEGFTQLTALFEGKGHKISSLFKETMGKVNKEVEDAKKNLLREESEYDSSGWIEDTIFVASALVQGAIATQPEGEVAASLKFTPSAMSALGYLVELVKSTGAFWQGENITASSIPDNIDLIKDRTSALSTDLEGSLEASVSYLKHFEDIVRTDPVKLETAAANFGHRWAMTTNTENSFEQSMTIGAVGSLYEAVMPLAFDQWILGPRFTSRNEQGPQELPNREYACKWVNGEGEDDGQDKPLANEWKYMSAMQSVAWGAVQHGPERDYLIRFLKEKDNNIELVRGAVHSIDEGDVLMRHKGEAPKEKLMKYLFRTPFDTTKLNQPIALGLNKEEFFGSEAWNMRELQCGHAR